MLDLLTCVCETDGSFESLQRLPRVYTFSYDIGKFGIK